MPWLRMLLSGLSVQWLGFSPVPVHVRFMMDKVALKPAYYSTSALYAVCSVCRQCDILWAPHGIFINNTVTAKWHAISTTVRVVAPSAHLRWAVLLSHSTTSAAHLCLGGTRFSLLHQCCWRFMWHSVTGWWAADGISGVCSALHASLATPICI